MLLLELSVVVLVEYQLLHWGFRTKHFICCFARWPVHSIRVFCLLFNKNLVRSIHLKLVVVIEVYDCSDGSPHPTLNWVTLHRSIIKRELISDGLSFSSSGQVTILFGHNAGFVAQRHPFGLEETCVLLNTTNSRFLLVCSVATDSS